MPGGVSFPLYPGVVLKKAIFILVVIGLSLLYYAGALTKKAPPFSKESFSSPVWDWKKTSPVSKEELDRLHQLKLDRGLRNVPVFSSMLAREAERARKGGDLERAVEFAQYSVKFSPDLPEPYFELARQRFYRNSFQLPEILSEVYGGLIAQVHYFPASLRFFYNLFFIVSNAILMTFVVFGVVVMVKYLPLYFHDIRTQLTREIPSLLINSLKVFFLFIPFLLRLDMLWAILFWSVLLWGYVTDRERRIVLFFFIAVVYLPFFLRSSSSLLDGSSSEVLLETNRANYEEGDRTTEGKLRAWLSQHPDDPQVLFTLGLMEKRQGRYAQAEEFYQKAIHLDPRFDEALSNLGNAYFARKQTDRAIASYQRAIDLSPDKGAYYFNLYRAYSQETFFSRNIDRAFQRARHLDPFLVDHYSRIDVPGRPPNVNWLVIDEVLPSEKLWRRFLTELFGREEILYHLFKVWFERIPSRIPFMTALLFLVFFVVMSRVARTKQFLTPCPMCGIPTHRLHLDASNQEYVCFNCYRIFFQKEKLHPKIEERKLLQVRGFQEESRFVGRFLSFFFVGFGYLWREHLLKGLMLLFLFFVLVLRFAYWGGVIPSSGFQSENFWKSAFWGGAFILLYFLSLWRIYRIKPRFET
jgi:tetratricopeptide (TPR) repeat protein